jgi:hypothetical protein
LKTPANVTIVDSDANEFTRCGVYYDTGMITCNHQGVTLIVDPANYCPSDPKRMWDERAGGWSDFCVKSVVLDSKIIVKTGKNTS